MSTSTTGPDAEKLFMVRAVLRECGYKYTARLMIEKAFHKQSSAVTHA